MSERVVAVVQARMGSTRLPGKVMLPLAGEHVLTHDVRRLRAAEAVDEVVVATSTAGRDDIVARYAERAGAAVHRGPEDDVLGRMHAAARDADADVVVRATGDDPLVAPAVVNACAEAVRAGADYAGNTIDRTFPQGLVVEAMSMASFDRVEAASDEPHQREHVTQYYLEHPDAFEREPVRWDDVYDWPLPCDRRDVRLALDEPDDYELLSAVYGGVEPDDRGILPVRDAITYALAEGLTEWNRHVGQTKVQGDE
ncbi:cytidylyltransferase domain-containing protein [Haloglomus litoreum]|uniref:cytidylyltransferase domain-containing protein n=1 Tax=Haloglomus litoreum TaxID=3034026 RepID=UPI0023E7A341|nr:NTP transferase domain-containing protein [Haloglomus sp. DT116]